jgi:hypothetical protein
MSKTNDINTTFAQLAGLILFASVISLFATGQSYFLTAGFMIYFMLVATNSIKRGEAPKKRR